MEVISQVKNFEKELSRLQNRLANTGFICLGSINEVYTVCGSRYCGCKKDKSKSHGPYYLWTRKVKGKTKSKYLSKKQADVCLQFLKNHEKLMVVIENLKKLSENVIENSK